MGKALMPHAPISGLIFPPVTTIISLPNSSPATVSITKATAPRSRITSVSPRRKLSAVMVEPMARPRNRVAMLMISFCAALLRRSTTPDSRSRLPSMRVAISGAASGAIKLTTTVTTMGNSTTARCETGLGAYSMRIRRSLRVVSRRMIGGWMIGMRLM